MGVGKGRMLEGRMLEGRMLEGRMLEGRMVEGRRVEGRIAFLLSSKDTDDLLPQQQQYIA